MGLEVVKDEVIGSAKQEAELMIAQARKEAQKAAKEAEKNIEDFRQKSQAETKKLMDLIKRQELASAELESKKMILNVKKQAIDKVFAEAKSRLESMDDKKREEIIKRLLDKTKSDIEIGFICCNRKDAKFFKGFKVENIDILGGFIAESKDKTLRVDNSFETMLESIKDKQLHNINKILVG